MTRSPGQTSVARMTELRKAQGLSAERLAAAMTNHGVPWTRDVVAGLERGRRDRLDVDELLALALVLGVPPIALLVDPSSRTSPVTPAAEAPTVVAVRWLLADAPLAAGLGEPFAGQAGAWGRELALVRLTREVQQAVQFCTAARRRSLVAAGRGGDDAQAERDTTMLRESVLHLSEVLAVITEEGLPTPPLPDADGLAALARDHGIVLGVTRDPLGMWDDPERGA